MSPEKKPTDLAYTRLTSLEREVAEEWKRLWDGQPTTQQPVETFHVTPADLLPPDAASLELHGYWTHEGPLRQPLPVESSLGLTALWAS